MKGVIMDEYGYIPVLLLPGRWPRYDEEKELDAILTEAVEEFRENTGLPLRIITGRRTYEKAVLAAEEYRESQRLKRTPEEVSAYNRSVMRMLRRISRRENEPLKKKMRKIVEERRSKGLII